MWKAYSNIIRRYPRLPLTEERRLISKAQNGSRKSKDEIVLRHISFLIFRIHKIAFPVLIRRFGEDLLEEAILWKRIDGFIIDYLKKEINKPKRIRYQLSQGIGNGKLLNKLI